MSFLSNLFGSDPKIDFKMLVDSGATILDVRNPQECAFGSIAGAINIPINLLPQKFKKIDKRKPVVVYCASGMRSASAKVFLEQNGYNEVYDGGGFRALSRNLGQ